VRIEKNPEIQFSQIKEYWQEYKLGEVYKERKEKGTDSLPILSVSIHNGISDGELDSNGLGKEVIRSEDKSLYKHVYPGDLVLNMMRAWQGAYGVVKSEGMVSPAYITAIPSSQIFPPFMEYCLRRDEMISQINNLSYGVTDFRKRLYWKSFINILCYIPSIPEQKKITTFFTQLDKTISIHQQELDMLKQTKHGFLQKMFPKEGESVPEIRFSGFTDTWERRELRDVVVSELKGKAKAEMSGTESVYLDTAYLNGGEASYVDSPKNVEKDDVLILWDGSQAGTVYHGFEGALGSTLKAYKPKESSSFLYQYLKRQQQVIYESYRTPNIPHVVKSFTTEFKISVPDVEEQEKIGEFFASIDNLITLHQRELDILNETKKGFLQKMFL
jgi:type I restriction enzyme, S subunit